MLPVTPDARVPVRTVLVSVVVLWTVYFIMTTLRGVMLDLDMQSELLLRRAGVALFGMIVTLALWLILRPLDSKPLWLKIVAAAVFAIPPALFLAQANRIAFADVQRPVILFSDEQTGVTVRRDEAGNILVDIAGSEGAFPEEYEEEADAGNSDPAMTMIPVTKLQWQRLTDILLARYYLLLVWCALYFALLAVAQTKAAERRGGEFRRAAKAAELRSLRYQVNPHFLFNSLNSLSALVMTDRSEQAEEMIHTISRFYRRSLIDDPTSDVPLADEFDSQRLYLAIETVRFPDRLRTRLDLPEHLEEARVPGMILQPLVENSVKYSVAARTDPVTISITAHEENGRLIVRVSDETQVAERAQDGGNSKGSVAVPQHGFGIGLANVRDRLLARFGKDASITSGPTAHGYETELRLPLIKHGF
ncbi:Histidine kinase [Alteripontixanthobacter maritimus]|uniref:Histidine kinase n=1 Tax=Alteripontixanthobacter maritimus TaxID=2161824 RepID=A0A369Q8E8_9SPHN|nr:histidine kinase [Alteripontixanthobacter maritimus]RDC61173.1 Histidine kinase [Alteripontixanthobacter maritimus]